MLRLREGAVIVLGNLSRQETVTPKFAQLIVNGLDLGNGPGALCHAVVGLKSETGR